VWLPKNSFLVRSLRVSNWLRNCGVNGSGSI
jgi:hypothetical protein